MACDDVFPVNLDPFNQAYGSFLNTDGSNCMLAPLKLADGVATLPGLSFCSDPNTGMLLSAAHEICFAISSSICFCLSPTSFSLVVGGIKGIFTHTNTAERTYTFPDKTGIVALLSDIGTFSYNETPSGSVNGINDTFTLAETPDPSNSLHLYWNGQLLIETIDFTISGDTITFLTAPSAGYLRASYKYT